jgi:hypothetical protein
MEPTSNQIWQAALDDLALQMTRSTFNTLLQGAQLIDAANNHYTIEVRNESAKEWLQKRLSTTLQQTLSRIAGRPTQITITAAQQRQRLLPLPDEQLSSNSTNSLFPGFEPFQSNFVTTPKQFFEIVVPAGPPVLTAFVAAVINNTIGVITNYHTGARREWWEASYPEIGAAAGIESRVSVRKAVDLARTLGYVVRAKGQSTHKYRLRREGEPVDNPRNNPQKRIKF